MPTADTIKSQWQRKDGQVRKSSGLNKPDPLATLLGTYQTYLSHLDTRPKEERKAPKTLFSYRIAGDHLADFLKTNRKINLLAESVTPGFGMQFYDFLREQSIGADTANRYLNFLKAALHHALLYDKIRIHGLFQFKPLKGSTAKRIVFLSESALVELEALPLIGIRCLVSYQKARSHE